MDHLEFNFYAALARLELLRRQGTSFQDFFVQVGTHRWGSDFEPRRPQGRIGDRKCDGYRPSNGTVYQCYAPRSMSPRPLCKKMAEDFLGAARNAARTPINNWTLVHNDFEGLPTEAHELVIRLRSRRRGIVIETWGPENLLVTIMELPREKLMLLFPQGLSSHDIRKIGYRDIDELIESLGPFDIEPIMAPPDAPSSKKLAHNGFSNEVATIIRSGYLVHKRFASYFSDTSRAVVGNRLAEKFKVLYAQCQSESHDADQIFFSLAQAVGGLDCARPRRAAIVGLITYMFHTCEIYEDAPSGATV